MRPLRPLPYTTAWVVVALCVSAAAAAADGQQPAAPPTRTETIRTEEVRFHQGEITLAGEVHVPSSNLPAPAVVLIHGSGPSDRSQAWASAFARGLAERGVAVLLPDKRGSAASGGDWKEASFEDLADDAIAGLEVLRRIEGVDSGRIGALGLSQGGHIAPLAASRSSRIAFVVNVSGSAVPITEQVIDEVEKLAERRGFSPGQIDRVNTLHRAAIRYALTGEGWDEYEADLAAALESDLAGHGVVEPFPRTRDHWVWSWARLVGAYDPLPYWQALEVPGLVIYGGQDTQIHVLESVERLLATPAGQTGELTLALFAQAGHGLSRGHGHEYGIRPDVLSLIASWIAGLAPPASVHDSP
ncbi:MAG TPA: alpha/beta fold hydrolase [Thermoanaerobaculia bacterium]|nr:alpha/beta fold hydrolase [Thermoanaerobaculia bacterium]